MHVAAKRKDRNVAHVGLVACVGKKRPTPARARDLYDSALFAKSRQFVEEQCDSWFILSAKYGLVAPDQVIEPYEETLNTKSQSERALWAKAVWTTLCQRLRPGDRVTVLAGERYREQLVPLIERFGCRVSVPMQGLGIGRQLQWLSEHLRQSRGEQNVERFYTALRKLEAGVGGARVLSVCTARDSWPRAGVYIFFEPGETRRGALEPRVVRIGTHGVSHGSRATLWQRLRTHRGSANGLGNHRSSIFRLHAGAALCTRNPELYVPSWGSGQSAPSDVCRQEQELERQVSAYIGAMKVLWLAIEDAPSPSSDRAYIERNLIGMLAAKSGPADPPSSNWLGQFSCEDRIRRSGLWNLDFLGYPYAPDCLDVLDEYVSITTCNRPVPGHPIAPQDWYANERNGISRNQLSLFDSAGA